MSGYAATLEDCAGSIFNRNEPDELSRLRADSSMPLSRALSMYAGVRKYHERLKSFRTVLNGVFTGDEKAEFYALDAMFIERAYLMDKDVLNTLRDLHQKSLAEEDAIRRAAEKIEYTMPKCGLLTRRVLARVLEILGECFDIMDSSVFAIEEVLSYAKNKER